MIRLAVVVDKNPGFLYYSQMRLAEEWTDGAHRTIGSLVEAEWSGDALFKTEARTNVPPIAEGAVKDVVSALTAASAGGSLERVVGDGLVLLFDGDRRRSRGLEKLVESLGGAVVTAPAAPRGASQADVLLESLNLSREAKGFLSDFAGDDYHVIAPLVLSLSKVAWERQPQISVRSLRVRLISEGSVKPWLVEQPIFEGNVDAAADTMRRVLSGAAHPLVVAKILSNKTQFLVDISSVLESGAASSMSSAADVLRSDRKGFAFKKSFQMAKRLGPVKCRLLWRAASELSYALKGGSSAEGEDLCVLTAVLMANIVLGAVSSVPGFTR